MLNLAILFTNFFFFLHLMLFLHHISLLKQCSSGAMGAMGAMVRFSASSGWICLFNLLYEKRNEHLSLKT